MIIQPITRDLLKTQKSQSQKMIEVERFLSNISAAIYSGEMKLCNKILHQMTHLLKKKWRKNLKKRLRYSVFPVANKHRFSSLKKVGYK